MTNIDAALSEKLDATKWRYADRDLRAVAELTGRIAATGRKLGLITYSDLVRDVPLSLPNINDGAPFTIDVYDWRETDRVIIGDFLGFISANSFREGKFLASALVVNRAEFKPSPPFFAWMKSLGVLPNLKEDTVLAFWAEQVNRAHQWYSRT